MSHRNRPLSWCWKFYSRKQDKNSTGTLVFVGYCQSCNARYKTNAALMEKHLDNCNKVGVETRKEIDRLLKKPAVRRNRSYSFKLKKAKLSEAVDVSSQASSRTIKHFFDPTSKDDQKELDILLTRAFTTGNISPNFIDNPFLKQFMSKLRPSYKLPSRSNKYSKVLIPAEFKRVQKSLEKFCNKADFLAIFTVFVDFYGIPRGIP